MYIVAPMKALFALLLLIPLLAAPSATPRKPVRWSIVGGSSARPIAPGKTVNVTLQAEIDRGWHIYSLTQKPGGPIPLRIQLVGGADVSIRGAIKGPTPVRKFDENFSIETEYYSGTARFTLPLGVPAGSLTGKRNLQIAARYQVCSATICLPARTEKLELNLQIRALK